MKTVIITGANGNLGSVVTQTFLSKGYRVIATVHNEDSKKEFSENKNLQVEVIDLSNEEATASFVHKAIETFKAIDGALLLAGGFAMGDIAATGSGGIRKQMSINFDTAYHVARPVFQQMMKQNKGRIVFVGSRPALKAVDGKKMIAYSLSKSLLFKLADYLNAEAKGKNVTATVVVPSTIDTEPNRKSMPDADWENWVKPEELAEIMEFVVSDKSAPLRETVLKIYNNS